jgi:outer membrane protein assembly factor BamB
VIRYPVGRPPEVGVRLLGYGSVDRVEISNTVSIEVKLHRAVSWRYDAGSAVRSMAMGPAKTLLVATRDGLLAAVDVGTAVAGSDQRSPAWVFRTNEPLVGIQSGIAVFDAQLYFGTSSVYALDLGAGIERRWAVPVGGRVMAPVTAGKISLVAFGDFVFGTCNDARGNGTVWAIDNAKGVVHWRKQPSESKAGTKASALQQGAQLYVPFEDGKVYSFEATNGNVLGTWQVGSAGRMSSLVMSGGMAWIATGEGKVHALDLENPGRPARTFDSGWPISTDLAVRDGIAYFGDQRGNLTAVDLTTLKRVWEPFTGDGSVMGSLAVTDTTVYFGTSSGWVFAVERGTGALAWKYRIGQEIVAGAFFEGRYLCVGAADGFVYGFDEFRMPEAP